MHFHTPESTARRRYHTLLPLSLFPFCDDLEWGFPTTFLDTFIIFSLLQSTVKAIIPYLSSGKNYFLQVRVGTCQLRKGTFLFPKIKILYHTVTLKALLDWRESRQLKNSTTHTKPIVCGETALQEKDSPLNLEGWWQIDTVPKLSWNSLWIAICACNTCSGNYCDEKQPLLLNRGSHWNDIQWGGRDVNLWVGFTMKSTGRVFGLGFFLLWHSTHSYRLSFGNAEAERWTAGINQSQI